eukprot:362108-Chlamydomonas_euryale.AAC.3
MQQTQKGSSDCSSHSGSRRMGEVDFSEKGVTLSYQVIVTGGNTADFKVDLCKPCALVWVPFSGALQYFACTS